MPKLVPSIPIELDKPRTLRFNYTAVLAIEDTTGKGIKEVLKEGSVRHTMTILWACLLHEDDTLTLKQVTNLVDFGDTEMIMAKIAEAIAAQFPDKKPSAPEGEAIPQAKTTSSTGA